MLKMSNLLKVDLLILTVLALLFIGWFSNSRADSNIGKVDLAGSVLSCEKDKKWSHYRGYFELNGKQYYSLKKYRSCDNFKAEIADKSLVAKHLKSNGLILELTDDDKFLYDSGFYGVGFGLVLVWFLSFAVVRVPIRWLLKKRYNKLR
jgi:hypothetical protein